MSDLRFTSEYQNSGRDWKNGDIFLNFPRGDVLHMDCVEDDLIKYKF